MNSGFMFWGMIGAIVFSFGSVIFLGLISSFNFRRKR